MQRAGAELLEFGELGIPQRGELLAGMAQPQRVFALAQGIVLEAGDLAEHPETGGEQGGHGDGGEEGILGRRQFAEAVVGEAEQVVALRLEVEQPERNAGVLDGSLEIARGQRGAGHAEQRAGRFRIDGERLLEGGAGFIPALEPLQHLAAQGERVAACAEVAVELFELGEGVLVAFFRHIGAGLHVTQGEEVRAGLGEQLAALAAEFFLFLVAHRLDALLLRLLGFLGVELEFLKGGDGLAGFLHAALADGGDQRAQLGAAALALVAGGELETEAVLHRPRPVEALEDGHGLGVVAAVDPRLGEVVVELAHGLLDGLGLVGIRLVDVAEGDELLEGGLGIGGGDLLVRRVHAVIAGDGVPAGDAGDFHGRVFVDVDEHLAVHVLADWQAEEVEQGRADIDQAGAVHALVLADAGALGGEDAELAVLGSRAGGLARDVAQAQVVRVEAVVGHEDHGGVLTRESEQGAEHRIVIEVAHFHAVVEDLVVPVVHLRPLRRVIFHERVAEVVDGVVIDAHQVPGLVLDQGGGGGVDAGAVRDDLGERLDARVLFRLVEVLAGHAVEAGQERTEVVLVQLRGMEAEVLEVADEALRMDGFRLERPFVGLVAAAVGFLVVVGNHHAVAERLGGVGRPPADGDGVFPLLVEDIPDGLGLAREIGDRADAAGDRVRLGEAEDTMLVRALAGGDGGPERGAERGLEGGDVAHHAFFKKARKVGHFAGVEQRVDDLPVRGVPADEQHFAGRGRRGGGGWE